MIDIASHSATEQLTMEEILAIIRWIYAVEEQANWRGPVETEEQPAPRYLSEIKTRPDRDIQGR